jgi:hypothetical protein
MNQLANPIVSDKGGRSLSGIDTVSNGPTAAKRVPVPAFRSPQLETLASAVQPFSIIKSRGKRVG